MKIQKIKMLSFVKVLTAIMAFWGLIAGIVYSVGGFIYEAINGILNPGTALAFWALLGMPLLFAAAGFVLGFLIAIPYNIIAKWIGGIEMDTI